MNKKFNGVLIDHCFEIYNNVTLSLSFTKIREGTMKAGDRLIAVDGRDITKCSLIDAQETLRRVERTATLTIE